MDHNTKRNITLLAERFKHTIKYEIDLMILSGELNNIKLSSDKYGFTVSYNTMYGNQLIQTGNKGIYHVLIELFRRIQLDEMNIRAGDPITLDDLEKEGEYTKQALIKLAISLHANHEVFKSVGGNRYDIEFYKGILIIMDDLCWSNSNVLSVKELQKMLKK